MDWFEIISENFMDTDGRPRRNLARIREHYPLVMHGVSLSIGTVDPLNSEYLTKLKALIDWAQPAWVSDHLCWTGVAHRNTHDLLPVPYTEEALRHITARIRQVQDFLGRPIALENPSTYLEFTASQMPEAEFIARMAEDSGCYLLLDVNNVYVTCYNHRLDPKTYLDALPLDRVIQIHLSGHTNKGSHIIDTHDDHVIPEVWQLYRYVVSRAGRIPNTMIEWDDHIPEFPVLAAELGKAKAAAGDLSAIEFPRLAQAQLPQRANHSTPLEESQAMLQEAIMRGEAFDSRPEVWIRHKQEFDPQEQLRVYVNAYRYRLHDVVAEDYPVLKAYLGEAAFNALIHRFIDEARPEHFNIGRFALKLPDFVRQALPEDGFAQEICVLETHITQLADRAETLPLESSHLLGMTPERLMESRLYPRISLALLSFRYPVNDYYRRVMEDEAPLKPAENPCFLAVFRHEDVMWRMELDAQEFTLLSRLFDGFTVAEALEQVEESAAEQLSEWFARWMRNGLLAAYDYTPTYQDRSHYAAA